MRLSIWLDLSPSSFYVSYPNFFASFFLFSLFFCTHDFLNDSILFLLQLITNLPCCLLVAVWVYNKPSLHHCLPPNILTLCVHFKNFTTVSFLFLLDFELHCCRPFTSTYIANSTKCRYYLETVNHLFVF